MTEPASVVVARQLADEVRARRTGVECAASVVSGHRGQQPLHSRRVRAVVVAAGVLAAAGCGGGQFHACPAIGFGSSLAVQLADGWPAGVERSVEFVCDPACPSPVVLEEPSPQVVPFPATPPAAPPTSPAAAPADPVVQVDGAGRAVLNLWNGAPDAVTVRVLEAGVVVAEVTAEPEFARVDGTEECGGNTQAKVVVPDP